MILKHLLSIVAILLLSVSIYSTTFKNGFVYDDIDTVVKSTLIKDTRNLPKLFQREGYFLLSGEKTYRPVVTFTYFIDYKLYGLAPWGFHLSNIFLHAANGVLLYLFLVLFVQFNQFNLSIKPLATVLLFSTHPILSEAVNGVSFREDILIFAFYFSSLVCYLMALKGDRLKPVYYLGSYLTFFLALFTKEMAATLPLMILLIDRCLGINIKRRLWRYAGYIVIGLFYIYVRFFLYYNPFESGLESEMFLRRFTHIPMSIGSFFHMLFLPVNLSTEYLKQDSHVGLNYFIGILILGYALFTFKNNRWKNTYTYGLLWICLTLIPVYNLIPIANPLADRYLYLAAPGVAMILSAALNKQPGYLKMTLLSLILLCNAILVIERNTIWKDEYSLWSNAVKKAPTARAYFMLGYALYNMKEYDKAVGAYLKSLSIRGIHMTQPE